MMVLLVEDGLSERLFASHFLNRMGCEVIVAENGLEALAIISHEPVDLVILDLCMPVLDGVEMIKRIRAGDGETRNAQVRIVVWSVAEDKLEEALNAGADDALLKSCEPSLLRQCIEKHHVKARQGAASE